MTFSGLLLFTALVMTSSIAFSHHLKLGLSVSTKFDSDTPSSSGARSSAEITAKPPSVYPNTVYVWVCFNSRNWFAVLLPPCCGAFILCLPSVVCRLIALAAVFFICSFVRGLAHANVGTSIRSTKATNRFCLIFIYICLKNEYPVGKRTAFAARFFHYLMVREMSVSPTDKNEDTDKKLSILLLLSCFQQHIRPCADHEVWLPGGAQACHRWCKHLLVCRP